ncbi:MAG: hypothetical protein HKN43_11740 [Rhodothermales bacterium]|nr:hypothetical protein [Rhodothermales bacterium]
MHRITIILLLFMLAACSTENPAGSGSIDGFSLGLNLELDLEDLQSQGALDGTLVERVRNLVPASTPHLDSVHLYTATAVVDEERQAVEIGAVRFGGELAGAVAAVVVDDTGHVKGFRVWGIDDERADWENFSGQFEYKDTRRLIQATAANSDSAAAEFARSLEASDNADSQFKANAYRHLVLMRSNSQVVRTTMALSSIDETPTAEWYEDYVMKMGELAGIARAFEPVIGPDAVAEYLRVVDEASSSLNAIAGMASEGNVTGVRNAITDYRRRTCGACHGIESHTLGEGELDDSVLAYFNENGVHRDWYRVGLDVWPVPGESAASQTVASSLKAMLMLLNR